MNYYTEIESYIKKNEVSKKVRIIEENQNTLEKYWNIGRLLVEAQRSNNRATYGNGLIKKWSIKYTEKYGKGYNRANLFKFRKFYLLFPNVSAVRIHLTWTHIKELLPIKEENKRNYYINLCIAKKLSSRELIKEIKNNSYERLINKPNKIEIITPQKNPSFLEQMKNPILIELDKNETDLETAILAKLQNFLIN